MNPARLVVVAAFGAVEVLRKLDRKLARHTAKRVPWSSTR